MSRRMCCSRVCSASRYAGRPSASTETPTRRPGRCRSSPARDGHEAGVRAAVEQRDAEALRGADHDVGAERARATRAGSAPAGRRRRRPGAPRSWAASIDRRAGRGPGRRRRGTARARRTARRRAARRRGRRRRPRCPSPRRGCGRPRWSAAARRRRRRTGRSALLVAAAYQRHRLGGRGALVEQRRVGGRQPGEVADHGLEVEQRLEPALGDLRLVRRVGGVPARVLEHVAPDHRRRDRAVVAEADHRLARAVARRRAPAARGRPASSVGGRRAGRASSAARMPPGTAASIRASSESKPSAASIVADVVGAAGRCGGRRTAARPSSSARRGVVGHGGSSTVGVGRVASPSVAPLGRCASRVA